MRLTVIRSGNLLGSPDVKELLRREDEAGGCSDSLWDELAGLKRQLGYDGCCSAFLLEEPARPELFPALVDPSFDLRELSRFGLAAGAIRTVLVTHAHLDHFDPALMRQLPAATAYAHPDSGVPGCRPFPQVAFAPSLRALDTPGHGCPHSSYLLDLPELDLAVCLAGDLVMSQAHFLSLEQPAAFADAEAGRRSLAAVLAGLRGLGRRHTLICPGHDRPFFVMPAAPGPLAAGRGAAG